ncbi:hypothetical protein FUAX_12610 [Fulvitalea axinellae]|uniref:YvbH-like oligomerisation region n=1 Tax=Fulvitalea axinellae TaxID=1182444 RepID=A0AAU9CQX5_9BACT|nr:hypothetical protein FUAX_12610 [Fulvitalea axinellae]
MFKKLASDVMGLSDIGKIISPEDYDKVASDDYVMHEDDEKIYFLIKSKTDEYCFTNTALIHLDGTSAVSSKRMLKRYSYKNNRFTTVLLETAGNVDLDVEIKFNLNDVGFSIDVDKKQLEQLKDLYKSLIQIASIQKTNGEKLEMSDQSLGISMASLKGAFGSNVNKDQFQAVNEYAYEWKVAKYTELNREDFGEVFEKYINN